MGHIPNLTNEEYHSHEALSSSNIKVMAKSPLHFKHFVFNGNKQETTDAMEFGTLLHSAILENKIDYVVGPDVSRATKEWKEFVKQNEGKKVLKPDDAKMIEDMHEVAKSNVYLQNLLSEALIEQSFFCEFQGIYMKARPDFMVKLDNGMYIIGDYKSTTTASKEGFTRKIFDLDYHISAIHYMTVLSQVLQVPLDKIIFIWVAQEKTAPYVISIFDMSTEMFDYSLSQYQMLLNKIQLCNETQTWPAYQEDIESIALPKWISWNENQDARIIEGQNE